MSLFRPEALEAQQTSALGRILLLTPRIASFLVAMVAGLTALLILFLFMGSYTRKATVVGEIVPERGVIRLYPPQSGRVEEFLVHSGDAVKKGSVLVRINSALDTAGGDTQARMLAALRVQREALLANIARNAQARADFAAQMARRREEMRAQEALLDGQERLLSGRKDLAARNEARYQRLLKKDFVAREAYEERAQERLALEEQLQQLKRERNSLAQQLLALAHEEAQQADSFAREAHELSRQLAQVEGQMAETESRQEVVLRAPQDGVVAAVFAETGQQAMAGQALLAIVPQDAQFEAVLYARSHDMGFVAPGQTVYLRYGAYPYQKFGQYAAVVEQVAKTAAPVNELTDTAFPALQGQSVYRIRARLAEDYIVAYGDRQALMAGMQFEADMVQDERRIYEWMVEPLFSLRSKWSAHDR